MPPASIRVRLPGRVYDVAVTESEEGGLGPFAASCLKGRVAFVVTDENVTAHADTAASSLRAAGFHIERVVLPPGEAQKCLATASALYDRLAALPADRHTAVVAVGGGVVGDLAGFVAATFARGLPLLMVPTTLLAMVDSAVGGKVAVNHPRGKNLIGAFHQPAGVWVDVAVLATLPEREYRSGLAEVVKYGVALDADFFAWLEANARPILDRSGPAVRHVVERCCRLKADIVERDERDETGLRAVLNYGHTFAHAFETATGYGTWLHGEAVAAGMICAARLAERLGLASAEVARRQRRLLDAFVLPTAPPKVEDEDLLTLMTGDKKTVAGGLRFVLPRAIGHVELRADVPSAEVVATLSDLAAGVSAR